MREPQQRTASKVGRYWAFLVLAFAYLGVGLVLSDYGVVWTQPEEFNWRERILQDGTALSWSDIPKALDWKTFEYEPRSTRPLSHLVEIVDTKFRVFLWRAMIPHPSLSLTWILLLVISPWLFFKLLRNLEIETGYAALATALYVANPGTLSLAAVDFRPAKALANFAIVACLYWASRLERRREAEGEATAVSFWLLCGFLFVSFFADETAVVSFPAILWFFPSVVFASYRRVAAFAALPIATYGMYFYGIPWLSTIAGYELPRIEAYGPASAVTGRLGLSPLIGPGTLRDLPRNSMNFFSDFFGLADPRVIHSWGYGALWVAVVAGLVAVAGKLFRSRLKLGSPFWKSAVALLGATVFANTLMHVVDNRIWGLHWLNTYWPLFFLLFLAQAVNGLKLNRAFVGVLTCLVATASIYNFIYVNNSFKMFFYYRAVNFDQVIINRANKFDIAFTDGTELYRQTRAIWEGHAREQTIKSLPTELYYLAHDLRLMEPGTTYAQQWSVFDEGVRRFDMQKDSAGFFRLTPEVPFRRRE